MREDYEDFFAYQDDKKATVNVGEAAELLGLHPNTVYKYIRAGQLPATTHRSKVAFWIKNSCIRWCGNCRNIDELESISSP